jgi:aspartyl-tRNA(Asn)/glutamyl-tRNA(Gln) amidotransferase subunit A
LSEDLTWLPAGRIAALVATGELSPVEVTEHFLGRAEDTAGRVRGFQELDAPGAKAQAAAAERAVLHGDALGPLHGVPVGIKANVPVAGFGLYPLFGETKPPVRVTRDAPVVSRLRRAGAVVFGTTVVPGMGLGNLRDPAGDPTSDLSWHPRNPWDLGRVPGSSSAGSAAAVAAGVLPVAIGTDGGGSTRLPAAWCGVVGLHPTLGRVPGLGRGASGWSTTVGPITRDAADAALVLQAVAGPHGGTVVSLQDDPPDYLAGIHSGVEGLRLAWTDDFGFARTYAGPESERVLDVVRSAAGRLRELGASVEPTAEVWEDWWPHPTVMGAAGVSHERYQAAEDARQQWWETLRRVFETSDLLLTTTIQHVAFDVERWSAAWSSAGTGYPNGSFVPTWTAHTFMHNWLGWPAVSVPCGFVDGLPVGLQITGRPNQEPLVLRAAAAYLGAFGSDARPPAA